MPQFDTTILTYFGQVVGKSSKTSCGETHFLLLIVFHGQQNKRCILPMIYKFFAYWMPQFNTTILTYLVKLLVKLVN